MILALECDYCDDSESYRQIQFGNANNLRLMLSSRLRPLSRANAIIRPSMANRWPRLRIQFSNHDRIFSKRISVFDSDDLVIPTRRGERFSIAHV
jgi:hypothetical protein